MADDKKRPLLNPVLRFTKDPKPESVAGGGKNRAAIKQGRLSQQRRLLSAAFEGLAKTAKTQPKFSNKVVIYASMFGDSLAPTHTPTDLFHPTKGVRLIAPYKSGYLVEFPTSRLSWFSSHVKEADTVSDRVDISRVENIRFFSPEDVYGARGLQSIWNLAPEVDNGRAFLLWLMPLQDRAAAEDLLLVFAGLHPELLDVPLSLKDATSGVDETKNSNLHKALLALGTTSRVNAALRQYRQHKRASTIVSIPSLEALGRVVASGSVFKIEPVSSVYTTAPGEGKEPDRPLPANLSGLPIVGVVDGGLTASSYKAAEAWSAPPLISQSFADTSHGNRVTSLVVQGHDWNNNLHLPELYCQVGTVQAVPKPGSKKILDPQALALYLDKVIAAYPNTKVWNFSFNQRMDCDSDFVSYLGHAITELSRKHNILPIISIGNQPSGAMQPPADCEAAITVGGRVSAPNGKPGGVCPISLQGPGPSSMLKPDLSHFSHVRAIGGGLIKGASFSAALTSPLAAHTFAKLKEPRPDLVKALLINGTGHEQFDPAFGFGTPNADFLPWECKQGVVTMNWQSQLRPGAAYYWDLPIPPALIENGKLKGGGALTAVLNPHPLVADYAGPNYFSARVNVALQFFQGKNKKGQDKVENLLGSMDTDKIPERKARDVEHKWCPVRHHARDFSKTGLKFSGQHMRVYARVYVRDLYMYGYQHAEQVPDLETHFVLTLKGKDDNDEIYNQLRTMLGSFVESSILEEDIVLDDLLG